MNPAVPPPTDPATAKAVSDVIEYGGKAAISLASMAAFVRLIAKPYFEWRKKRQIEIVREAIKPSVDEIVAREREIFVEVDTLIELATDNRERLDEMNLLLDTMGFSSRDRRSSPDAEARLDGMIDVLVERRKQRRRNLPSEQKERAD